MPDFSIKFNGKVVKLTENGKVEDIKKNLEEAGLEELSVFIDDVDADGNKTIDASEKNKLETIFSSMGRNVTEEKATELAKEYNEMSDKSIDNFTQTKSLQNQEHIYGKNYVDALNTAAREKRSRGEAELLKDKYSTEYEIKDGNNLSQIAKDCLIQRGVEKPTQNQIMNEIIRIMVANDIKDANAIIRTGDKLKVSNGTEPVRIETETLDDGTSVVREFDENGNKTKETYKDAVGNVTKTVEYEYNEDGNNTKATEKDADGNVTKTVEYEYNEDGNNTKETTKDADGVIIETVEREYDADGHKTKVTVKDKDGNVTEIWEYEYGADGNKTKAIGHYYDDADGNVTKTVEHEYNEDGNNTKETIKDADGNVTETIEFEYDAYGHKTKSTVKDKDGNVTKTYEFEYNSDGYNNKTTQKDADGKVTNIYEFKYDSNGNTTKETEKDADGEVTKITEYEYDADGNVTKRTVKDKDGNIIE